VLIAYRFGFFKNASSNNEIISENINVSDNIRKEETIPITTIETYGKVFDVKIQAHVYKLMHEMANTLIIAEDEKIWGEIPITDEVIDKLIAAINESTFDDREKLLSILQRWKNKDFSQGVEDHNYVWKKLNGNIGKAIRLKEDLKK
jgi:hypothetical protein